MCYRTHQFEVYYKIVMSKVETIFQSNNTRQEVISSKKIVFSLFCFLVFLYPVSYEGLSINYTFLLAPFFSILLNQNLQRPKIVYQLFILVYFIIFLVAALYQYEFYPEILRRISSFILFMSMFTFMFVKIDKPMLHAFKISVVTISLFFSIKSILSFIFLGASSLGFEAKDLIGTQRFGFIYLLAIWIAFYEFKKVKISILFKILLILILALGLLLTFSRASLVSLFLSFFLMFLHGLFQWLKYPDFRKVGKVLGIFIFCLFLVYLLNIFFPIIGQFFDERLFSFFLDSETVQGNLQDENSSEGTRIAIQKIIFNFVFSNPFTGTGYLGVWNISNGFTGSAHNQHTDTLLRTGIVGFSIYIYIVYKLLFFLYKNEKGLFWGVIGMLIYGLFHETFKESQGGFVLSFLIGLISSQSSYAKNKELNF